MTEYMVCPCPLERYIKVFSDLMPLPAGHHLTLLFQCTNKSTWRTVSLWQLETGYTTYVCGLGELKCISHLHLVKL